MSKFILKRMVFAIFVVLMLSSPPVFIVFAQEIDPNLDSDGDGLTDWDEEHRYMSNPAETDTDGDTIDDGREVRTGTSPILTDSDGDFISDTTEYAVWNPLATRVEERYVRCPYIADLSHLTLEVINDRIILQQNYVKGNVTKTESISADIDQYAKQHSWGDTKEDSRAGWVGGHLSVGIQSQDVGVSVMDCGANAAVPSFYYELMADIGGELRWDRMSFNNHDKTILNVTEDTINDVYESYTEMNWDLSSATLIADISIMNTFDRTVRIDTGIFNIIVGGISYKSTAWDIPEITLGQGENLTLHVTFELEGDAWISELTTGSAILDIDPAALEQSVWNDEGDDWIPQDVMQEYVQTACALVEIDGVGKEIHYWIAATVDKLDGINVLRALDLLFIDYGYRYGRMVDLLGVESKPGQEVWSFAYFEQWYDTSSLSDELNFERLRMWGRGSLSLHLTTDSDGDWLADFAETHFGTDPNNPDTDGDYADDYVELALIDTNPWVEDTDGGGTIDGIEFYEGMNPHDPSDDGLDLPDWYVNHPTILNAKAAAEALLDHGVKPKTDELTWVARDSPAEDTQYDYDGLVTYVKNMTFAQVNADTIECIDIGDVDDDGDGDIVVGTSSPALLVLFENETTGWQMQLRANYTKYYGAPAWVTDVAIGHAVKNDPDTYIIVGTTYYSSEYLGDVVYYRNDPGDIWINDTINEDAVIGGVYSLAIGKVGDDNRTVLAVGDAFDTTRYNGNVTVYYKEGGSWSSEVVALTNESRVVVTIGNFDINYDGNEIVYCTYSHNTTLGYVTWKAIGVVDLGWSHNKIESISTPGVSYTSFMFVEMGDLEGDGDEELVVGVDRYEADSDSIEFYTGGTPVYVVEGIEFVGDEFVFDDFDNDGMDEVAYVYSNTSIFPDSRLMIYEINATEHVIRTFVESTLESLLSGMGTGDMDGDGDIEMLYGTDGNGWLVLWDRARGALWADQEQIWTINVTLLEPWIYEGEQFPIEVKVNNYGEFDIANLTMICSHSPLISDQTYPAILVSEIAIAGSTTYTFLLWPQTIGNFTIDISLTSFSPRISHDSQYHCIVKPLPPTQVRIGQALLDLAKATGNETLLNASMQFGNWLDSVKIDAGQFWAWNADANFTENLVPGYILPTIEAASFLLDLFRTTGEMDYLILALGAGRYIMSLVTEVTPNHLAFSSLDRGVHEAAAAGEFFMDINQELLLDLFGDTVTGLANRLCSMAAIVGDGYAWSNSLGLTEVVVHFLARIENGPGDLYDYHEYALGGGNYLEDALISGLDPWTETENPFAYYVGSGIAGVSQVLGYLEDWLELDFAAALYNNGQELIGDSYLTGQGRNWNEPIWTIDTDALAESVNFEYGLSGILPALGESYKNYGNQSTMDAIQEAVMWTTNTLLLITSPSVENGACELALADVIHSMLYVHSITPVIFVGYFVDPMTSLSGTAFTISGYVQTLGYYARGVNLTTEEQAWYILDAPQTEKIPIGTIPEPSVEVVTWDVTLLLHGTFEITVSGDSINAGEGENTAEVAVTDVGVTKIGGPYQPKLQHGLIALQVGYDFNNETLYNLGENVFLPIQAEYIDTQQPAYNASLQIGDIGLAVVDDEGVGYIVFTHLEPGTIEVPISLSYDKKSGITDGVSGLNLSLTFTSLEVRNANVSTSVSEVGSYVTFKGRVFYSHNDMPVAGASVALDGEAKAVTDSNGYYTFTHTEIALGEVNHTVTANSDADNRITFCSLSQTFSVDWVGFWNPVTMALAGGAIIGVVIVVIVVVMRLRKRSA
ncbi:MAG: hypothetical protein ACFFD3_17030 [Candidatus Thorarchaeota archaeon]